MKGGLRIPSFSVLLIFAVLTVIGAAMLPSLNLQYLPRDKQQTMSVTFYWQDASARVIESEVTSRIEGYIASIKGISRISSMSRKEEGSINITLKKKEDVDAIRFEISSALRSLYDQRSKCRPDTHLHRKRRPAHQPDRAVYQRPHPQGPLHHRGSQFGKALRGYAQLHGDSLQS